MIDMVGDDKLSLDRVGDARARPQVSTKTRRPGPAEQNPLQPAMRLYIEFRWAPWRGFGGNPPLARPTIRRLPAPHAASVYAQSFGHLDRCVPFVQKADRPLTTFLQNLWASLWSHDPPPAQSIGHFLCRSQ